MWLRRIARACSGDCRRRNLTEERLHLSLQRPETDHHAHWMYIVIYIMKMSLLLHLLDIYWQTDKKVTKMSVFIIIVYPHT